MPPPTSAFKAGAGKKDKVAGDKEKEKANGSSAATGKDGAANAVEAAAESTHKSAGKPDKAAYDAEQDGLNKQIADVKAKLDAVRSRIALSQGPKGDDRRSQIKAELDALRTEQGSNKANRNKTFEEMKRLQEGVSAKIKDVQAQRGKIGYKSTAEIDSRIDGLNRQVESGTMKLVDEKKALSEISALRRSRKQLESSGSADDAIAKDKARIDELRKQLDDPEAKKVSDKFDALKKEMDGLREEGNKAFEERGKLFDERNALSAQMDELYGKKRESAQKYRDDNDRHYAKVQADRQARHEKFKAEKAKEDAVRREEEIVRLREEAKNPAYAAEIEDCKILIGWFQGKYGGGDVPSTNAGGKEKQAVEGVKALEIRQVESDFKGMTLKKKDEEEMGGFFGGSGKKKGKGGAGKKSNAASGTATPSSDAPAPSSGAGSVNLPMNLLSALLSLGIPPPAGKDDAQRVVDDLETKKAWYEANSEAKTKAEVERVEKVVAKMQKKNALLAEGGEAAADDDDDAEDTPEHANAGVKEPIHSEPSLVPREPPLREAAAVVGSVAGNGPDGPDHKLPGDASETAEVKHVDSALEEIKESE